MAITKARDLAAIKQDVPSPVVDQDKIVSRTIHLCETQHERDFNDGRAFVISGDVPDAKIAGPVILSEAQRSRRIPRNYLGCGTGFLDFARYDRKLRRCQIGF